jgi:hypothetical protein
MLRSSHETASKGKLRKRDLSIAAGKKQQQQQRSGADGQL